MIDRLIKYLVLMSIIIPYSSPIICQTGWSNWEPLYQDRYIQVEIKFYAPAINACQSNGKSFKYKYRVKGVYRGYAYFLNWKINYVDCSGHLNYQANALEIGKPNPHDISNWVSVESIDYRILAAGIETKYYDVKDSSLQKQGWGRGPPRFSTAPLQVEGPKKTYLGQSIELKIKGGILGIGAQWAWYKNHCGGQKLGVGTILHYSPTDNIHIFVRAEGKNNTTTCAEFRVEVDKKNSPALAIKGRFNICKGEQSTLSISGGRLGLGANWVWYSDDCGGQKLGTGSSISVSPNRQTAYFVRAEGILNTTTCAEATVSVQNKSIDPVSITASSNSICEGESVKLSINGGRLAGDASWKWYINACGGDANAEGLSATFTPHKTTTYYVLGEGVCNNTRCITKTINVNPKLHAPSSVVIPDIVYKGKKVILSVAQESASGNGTQLHWYKDDLISKKYLGSGRSIHIRTRSVATYCVKAKGQCNETSCTKVRIKPIKLHKPSRSYLDTKKFLHYGFGIGLEWVQFNQLARYTKVGVVDEKNTEIQGLGLPAELILHPLFKEYISIGLMVGGTIGTTSSIFQDDETSVEKYLYTQWNYGGELAFGLRHYKFLLNYRKSIQDNDYTLLVNEGKSNEEEYRFDQRIDLETLGIGFRLGRYLKTDGKDRYTLDLLYTFGRNPVSHSFISDLNGYWSGVHGLSLIWWRHSQLKFKLDFLQPNTRSSSFDFEDPSVRITLLLNRDRFY